MQIFWKTAKLSHTVLNKIIWIYNNVKLQHRGVSESLLLPQKVWLIRTFNERSLAEGWDKIIKVPFSPNHSRILYFHEFKKWGFVYILTYIIPKFYFIAILPFCTFVFNVRATVAPICAFTHSPLCQDNTRLGIRSWKWWRCCTLQPVLPLKNISQNNLRGGKIRWGWAERNGGRDF